jgi:hypothetical protein
MTSTVTNSRDIYADLIEKGNQLFQQGKLTYHHVTQFLSEQYQLIKTHDEELFPWVLTACAIATLSVNMLSSTLFFTLGALYAVRKGDSWKEGIVNPITDCWKSSKFAKIALFAGAIVLAFQKWNVAAFALGITAVQLLKKSE